MPVLFAKPDAIISSVAIVADVDVCIVIIVDDRYIMADVSGANLNPAVSLGLLLGKRISIERFCIYLVVQVYACPTPKMMYDSTLIPSGSSPITGVRRKGSCITINTIIPVFCYSHCYLYCSNFLVVVVVFTLNLTVMFVVTGQAPSSQLVWCGRNSRGKN